MFHIDNQLYLLCVPPNQNLNSKLHHCRVISSDIPRRQATNLWHHRSSVSLSSISTIHFIHSSKFSPNLLITRNPNPLIQFCQFNMSITFQNLVTRHSHARISLRLNSPNLKTPNFDITVLPHYQTLNTRLVIPLKLRSIHTERHSSIRALESDGVVDKQYIVAADTFNIDAFLSIAEFFCLASSAVLSIGFVINSTFSTSQKPVLEWFGNRVTVWQSLLLVVGIVIGATIRRRQWRRICLGFSKPGSSGVNLVERIEKVEEDLRNSATIIRVLSRQLEKLGIRFRVTRKSMKEPIAQVCVFLLTPKVIICHNVCMILQFVIFQF